MSIDMGYFTKKKNEEGGKRRTRDPGDGSPQRGQEAERRSPDVGSGCKISRRRKEISEFAIQDLEFWHKISLKLSCLCSIFD